MISKEQFIATMKKIQNQDTRTHKFSAALNEMGDGHFVFDSKNEYLTALLQLLKADLHDNGEWIEWWLYESNISHVVTWIENDEPRSADLTESGALYDFLVNNAAAISAEKLSIRKMDDEGQDSAFSREKIDLENFVSSLDSVMLYLNKHDTALHIFENGEAKYVVLNIRYYNQEHRQGSEST